MLVFLLFVGFFSIICCFIIGLYLNKSGKQFLKLLPENQHKLYKLPFGYNRAKIIIDSFKYDQLYCAEIEKYRKQIKKYSIIIAILYFIFIVSLIIYCLIAKLT